MAECVRANADCYGAATERSIEGLLSPVWLCERHRKCEVGDPLTGQNCFQDATTIGPLSGEMSKVAHFSTPCHWSENSSVDATRMVTEWSRNQREPTVSHDKPRTPIRITRP